MSDQETPGGAGAELDEHAGRLLAVMNLLAEMSMQALRQGETDAARSFVDCIETLSVKTKGNVGPGEAAAFESVLYQLRLAVVKGPPSEEDESGESAEPEPGDGVENDDSSKSEE